MPNSRILPWFIITIMIFHRHLQYSVFLVFVLRPSFSLDYLTSSCFFEFLHNIFVFPKGLSNILSSFGFFCQNLSFSWIYCEILDSSGIFSQDLVFWDFRPRPWLLHEILTACLFPWISGQQFFSEISYQKSNVSWISCQHLDSFGFPAEKSLLLDFLPSCRFKLDFLIIPWYLKGFFPSVWFFRGFLSVVLIFFGIPAKIMSPHELLANFLIFLAFLAEISTLRGFLVTILVFYKNSCKDLDFAWVFDNILFIFFNFLRSSWFSMDLLPRSEFHYKFSPGSQFFDEFVKKLTF